ncbi:MAG TPA: TonB-dependent receptor, partial [Steroidobacteraceae bacterium]|nr:TonB-dependent receptor [Steroidobacteraceae bacterium]
HAGIDIARNGGPGQTTSVFIRGADSNQTTVLVDGVRINPGTIGGAQIQNIPPEVVDRIEVVKGPRSTLYGSDAIGGVINIITRKYSQSGFDASLGYGRYNTRQATFSGGFGGNQGAIGITGVWFDTDGFPARTASDVDSGFENGSFSLRGQTAVGAARLGARVWYSQGTTDYLDFFLTPVSQDFKTGSAAADVAFGTDAWKSRMTLSRIEDDIDQNQSTDFARTRRNALDWQNDLQLGANQLLTAGVLLTDEDTDAIVFGSGFDVSTRVNMGYLQDRFSLERQTLLLAVAYTDHETFGGETTWNAEYGFDFTPRTRLILSAGTGFRAPDSTDRFGFGGNPDLDPETSRNFEIGLRQQLGGNQLITLNAFRNDIDDLIEFVVTDPLTFDGQNQNIASVRIDGVEFAYQIRAADWSLRAEAIAQDPRDRTTDEQLLRRAKRSGTVSVAKAFGLHEFGLDVLMTGAREDFGGVRLEPYTLLNLYGRVALTPAWTVQLRLENALDEHYELANTYNTAGRSVFVATRYEFR